MPRMMFMNDHAGTGGSLSERLQTRIAYDARDWAASEHEAVLYAIVSGWDDVDGDPADSAYPELAERFGWTADEIAALRELHAEFNALLSA